MRIEPTSGANTVTSANTARRSGGDGFAGREKAPGRRPPMPASDRSAASTCWWRSRGSRTQENGAAAGRGRFALDALDALKLGLLEGAWDAGTVGKLKAAACGLTDSSGDPVLDGVLAEIELRLEVELAKIEPAAARQELPNGHTL
jgi:hypothetical protein